MKGVYELHLNGEPFLLLPQKGVFRPARQQLILADLHLGKTTHFRKQGLPLPQQILVKDIDLLHYLFNTWKPREVLILGDLFHSDYNREWLWFKSVLIEHADIHFILLEGNHDILEKKNYQLPNLRSAAVMEEQNFIFSHQPLKDPEKLNFCGHLHPGLRLSGRARMNVTLPCWYLSQNHFIMPAFGHTTGLHLLEEEESAEYFLVTGDRVVRYG